MKMARVFRFVLVLLIGVTAGCASHSASVAGASGDAAPAGQFDYHSVAIPEPRVEPRSRYGNPASYVVFGETYYVMDDASARGFEQRGIASWYGTKFHGNRTSSGEPYDMYAMTAAHKELPLPTYVEVENLVNGRKVIVRVNDRGPFHDGRIIDLSYAAALKLGVVSTGTAEVRIRALHPGESDAAPAVQAPAAETVTAVNTPLPPPTIGHEGSDWYIQLAAFGSADNALAYKGELEAAGLRPVQIGTDTGASLYRVRLGPYASEALANENAMLLAAAGITEFHIHEEAATPGTP
ncbi:MAG: septal ring lytic transglycosylase RlpA family protein [Gammaproteobacteria bacterium]|nr:septal ring lytic transglycosylase RlpA family protein [Gammaproteobacteria bacterium]